MTTTTRANPYAGIAVTPRVGRPVIVLISLSVLAVIAAGCFLTINIVGSWEYVFSRRIITLATLVLVSVAVGMSTIVFHTITENKILTPSIMGFDALYVLIQTILVFTLGAGIGALDPIVLFTLNAGLMVGFSLLLFGWLLLGAKRSLHALLLIGIVCGGLFKAGSGLASRMLDPESFAVLQDLFFARFNSVNSTLLTVSAAVVGITCCVIWSLRHQLDVAGLGRSNSINLGINHRSLTIKVLITVSILVSVSTALVGPTTFFGLLVAHLAYSLTKSSRHAVTIPAAILGGIVALVGGQTIVQHAFNFNTALSIVIDFIGGLLFILLVLRKKSL